MKPQSVVKHGRVPVLLAVVLVMSLGFTVVLASDPALTPSALVFQSPPPMPPANDNFASAIAIRAVPYTDGASITYATTQPGEQAPANCTGSIYKTVWYAYTPANSGSFMASVPDYFYFSGFLAVWSGTELGRLTEVGCRSFWGTGRLAFRAEAGTTYYIQLGSSSGDGDQVNFRFEVTPSSQV